MPNVGTRKAEESVKIHNKSSSVINAGKVRLMPNGSPNDTIEIPASKVSEGLKRLLANKDSGLEIVK